MRKSADQRISDVKAAIAAWTAAGVVACDRRVVFMQDSLARLERGKGLTTRQREWLDTLCAEGPPTPKGDPALLARIDAALPHLTPRGREAMTSFRSTITRGYELSEKQSAFMNTLLEEAVRVEREGRWQPSPKTLSEGVFAARVVDGRNSFWKGSHPGTVTAANRILSTLGPLRDGIRVEEAPDEWCFNKVINAVGPAIREFRNPKFEEGELVWLTADAGVPNIPINLAFETSSMALVTGGPEAVHGDVGYPVLVGSTPAVVNSKFLTRNAARAMKGPK